MIKTALRSIENTGYDEVSLSSLSPGDYSAIGLLTQKLMNFFKRKNISLSLSSIRPSKLDPEILEQIRRVRKTGFTLAPEAGTQRLRDAINKGISDEEILASAESIFRAGWQLIKLYFMIGLPNEQSEDLSGIVELTKKIIALGKKYCRPWINLSLSTFIPKPHSAFQWLPMERLEQIYVKQRAIKKMAFKLPINFKAHNPQLSFLEGIFSRGDRTLSEVLVRAWRKGCRFDGWGDQLRWHLWMESFQECSISPELYLYQQLPCDSSLPWDHISAGVRKEFLIKELELGLQGIPSTMCSPERCTGCGVCPPSWIEHRKKSKENLFKINIKRAHSSPSLSSTGQKRFFYRASLQKKGDMRFLSHLDFSRTIIRALRRAGVPLVYSQGFHPKPKISFSPALALGIEAEEEFIDFISSQLLSLAETKKLINSSLPSGLRVLRIAFMSEEPLALEREINIARYSFKIYPELLAPIREISGTNPADFKEGQFWEFQQKIITDFLSRHSITITRKKKGNEMRVDIKPLIHRLYLDKQAGKLKMELRLNRPSSIKPFEVIKVLYPKIDIQYFPVREKLFIFKEGKYFSPFGEEVKDE